MGQAEADRLRESEATLRDALARAGVAPHAVAGSTCYLLRTAKQTTYPTVANVYYHCELVAVLGSELEFDEPIHTHQGRFLKAYNYGAEIPPEGTYVIGCTLDYGIAFQYVPPVECVWSFVTREGCQQRIMPGSLIVVAQDGEEVARCTTSGRVVAIARTSTGSGYTSRPFVALTGGGGAGATARAVMQVGILTRTNGGSGYTDGTYTNLGTFTGGGGHGGRFTFTVSGGAIQGLSVTNGGSGYTTQPTPDFSAAGAGSGAVVAAFLNVKQFDVLEGGNGYTTAPTVAVTGGGASGFGVARGTASVAARCVIDVPPGSYDVTITPPEGSGWAPYAATLSRHCNVTTIAFEPDEDHVCGGCGYLDPTDPNGGTCSHLPKSVQLTHTIDEGWLQEGGPFQPQFPSMTLTLGPNFPQYSSQPAYWSEPFQLEVGPVEPGGPSQFLTCRYVIACLGPFINYITQDSETGEWDFTRTYPAGGPGDSFDPANRSCSPFWVRGGTRDCHAGLPQRCARWQYN